MLLVFDIQPTELLYTINTKLKRGDSIYGVKVNGWYTNGMTNGKLTTHVGKEQTRRKLKVSINICRHVMIR